MTQSSTKKIIKEDYNLPRWIDRAIDELAERRDSTRSAVFVEAIEQFLEDPKAEVPRTIEGQKVRPGFYLPEDLDQNLRVFAASKRRKKSLVAVAALTEYLQSQSVLLSA